LVDLDLSNYIVQWDTSLKTREKETKINSFRDGIRSTLKPIWFAMATATRYTIYDNTIYYERALGKLYLQSGAYDRVYDDGLLPEPTMLAADNPTSRRSTLFPDRLPWVTSVYKRCIHHLRRISRASAKSAMVFLFSVTRRFANLAEVLLAEARIFHNSQKP